jgi:phage terminase large subunit-like protein
MSVAVLDAPALIGDQPPRLMLAPPAASNAASEAIGFYESFGKKLDPWQRLSLRVGLGELGDGSWAAFEVGIIVSRQNGKGLVTECLELAALFLWGCKVVIHSAHKGTTVAKALRSMRELIKNNPDLARRCKPINDSDEVFELLTGAQLQFVTRTGSGGRGLTGDIVVIDEALKLNDEQKASLVPTLAAIPNAMLWYTSTVPAFADQHLCTVRERVLEGAPRLAWAEWTSDEDARSDDPLQLAKANPALNVRITLDRLHDLLGILGEALFRTECMGIWPNSRQGTLLNPVAWRGMVDVRSMRAPDSDVVVAFDCAPLLDHGSIGLHAYREDGLEHQQLLDYDEGIDWMVDRAVLYKEVLDPVLFVVDGKSGVMSILDKLAAKGIKRAEDPKKLQRGDLLVLELHEMADAVAQYIEGFRKKPTIYRHLDQKALNDAVKNVKPRNIGDGKIAYGRRISEVDIGPVIVTTEARYGQQAWLTRRAPTKARSKVW